MRSVVLTFVFLGSAACGLLGLFQLGSIWARGQQIDHAQEFRPNVITPSVRAEYEDRKHRSWSLLFASGFALLGIRVKRRAIASGVFLLAALIPTFFWMGALCPTAPFLLAASASVWRKTGTR